MYKGDDWWKGVYENKYVFNISLIFCFEWGC